MLLNYRERQPRSPNQPISVRHDRRALHRVLSWLSWVNHPPFTSQAVGRPAAPNQPASTPSSRRIGDAKGDRTNDRQAGSGGGGLDERSFYRQNVNAAAGRAKDRTFAQRCRHASVAKTSIISNRYRTIVQNPRPRFAAQLVTEAVAGPFAGPALKRLVHSGLRPPRPRHV